MRSLFAVCYYGFAATYWAGRITMKPTQYAMCPCSIVLLTFDHTTTMGFETAGLKTLQLMHYSILASAGSQIR